MTPRRLLFYTHALVGGGAERVWARLAAGFAERGDDVDFVVDFEAKENLAFLGDKARLVVLPKGHGAATLALARHLRRRRPHASLSALAVSNLKHTLAATLAGRRDRAILSYHGFYESERERLSNIGYRLTRPLSGTTAATIAVSESLRADLVARFGVAPGRVVTLFNPAAPAPFPAPVAPADLAAREPLVMAIGRLVPDKGFRDLLDAFAQTRTPGARLVILGEGPLRGELLALRSSLGLDGRVELPGFAADVGSELRRARCVALASPRESFGLVCVEALAHGLPCVTTDSGGPGEIVNAPSLGSIVPVSDPAALARALDAALASPGDPAPRQARAREFSLDAALERYEDLIARVMSHARSPA
ncbi:MAG TPA: glycosyltransferase [Rhodoblastus sp.]|nr:glycosyltransferase [Rhodoblastus sp.]